MTLQHESTLPVPEGMQPGTLRTLQLVLRELDQVLVPDLTSDRARSTATILGRLLRHLIVRETSANQLIYDWTEKQITLLVEAGVTPDVDLGTPLSRNLQATASIAELVGARSRNKLSGTEAGLADAWSKRALAAEREYYTSLVRAENEASYLANSEERTSLLDVTAERLTEYLECKLAGPRPITISKIQKLLGGFSKETFIVDMNMGELAQPIVLRRDVPFGAVAGSVVDEVPLLKALHAKGLPVPEPLLVETDRSLFGEAFFITRKAPGETAFSNIRGLQMNAGQERAALALAEVLGRLHAIDASTLCLPETFMDPTLSMCDCVLREVNFYEQAWISRTHRPSPTMSAAFSWLRANVPASTGRPCIVHGDAGLHNLMMLDGNLSVMLDWELSHMGDPIEDLAYSRTWIDQVLPWDDFLAIYYRHGGREYRPSHESYYRVLANLRVVVFAAQAAYGSHWSEHPELTLMFAATHYHAVFLEKVAKQLEGI